MTKPLWQLNPLESMHQPQGWQGPWPPAGSNVAFPPGFPGPPPAPQGANAHPQWEAGFWQYNPGIQAGVPWAPGVGWASQVNFNPYKRIPRPPDPSYWETRLTNNGLGLEGMVPRLVDSTNATAADSDSDVPQTPWIWNPPSLLENGDRPTPTRDFNGRRSKENRNSVSRQSSFDNRDRDTRSIPAPADRSAEPQSSYFPRQPPFNTSAQTTPERRGPLGRPTDPNSFYQRSSQTQPPLHSQTQPSPNRSSSNSSSTSLLRSSTDPHPQPYRQVFSAESSRYASRFYSQEPESFTSKLDLHPTFSPNIVRTPTHYQTPSRRSFEEPGGSHSYRISPSSAGKTSSSHRNGQGPLTAEPLTRVASLPSTSSTYPSENGRSPRDKYPAFEPLNSHSSLPTASSSSSFSSLTTSSTRDNQPEGLLSPLIGATPRPGSGTSRDRSISRSHTEPTLPKSLTPILETRMAPHSDVIHPLAPPPDDGPIFSSLSSRDKSASSSSRRLNPLPPPPTESINLAASTPPRHDPPPARYTRRIRKGFWNRRGDHLTPNSYVVYAPQDRAYPAELRDYPDEREGYRDQFGTFVPFLEDRPELPTSLPYRGRPPTQPYDSFVAYTYQ